MKQQGRWNKDLAELLMVIGRKRVNFFDNFEDGDPRYEDHPLETMAVQMVGVGEFRGAEMRGYLSRK